MHLWATLSFHWTELPQTKRKPNINVQSIRATESHLSWRCGLWLCELGRVLMALSSCGHERNEWIYIDGPHGHGCPAPSGESECLK